MKTGDLWLSSWNTHTAAGYVASYYRSIFCDVDNMKISSGKHTVTSMRMLARCEHACWSKSLPLSVIFFFIQKYRTKVKPASEVKIYQSYNLFNAMGWEKKNGSSTEWKYIKYCQLYTEFQDWFLLVEKLSGVCLCKTHRHDDRVLWEFSRVLLCVCDGVLSIFLALFWCSC